LVGKLKKLLIENIARLVASRIIKGPSGPTGVVFLLFLHELIATDSMIIANTILIDVFIMLGFIDLNFSYS